MAEERFRGYLRCLPNEASSTGSSPTRFRLPVITIERRILIRSASRQRFTPVSGSGRLIKITTAPSSRCNKHVLSRTFWQNFLQPLISVKFVASKLETLLSLSLSSALESRLKHAPRGPALFVINGGSIISLCFGNEVRALGSERRSFDSFASARRSSRTRGHTGEGDPQMSRK